MAQLPTLQHKQNLCLPRIAANTEFRCASVKRIPQARSDSGRIANARLKEWRTPAMPGLCASGSLFKDKFRLVTSYSILNPIQARPFRQNEIRARMNLAQPGSRLTEQAILHNADEIRFI